MRISDWSSDVCSSDLSALLEVGAARLDRFGDRILYPIEVLPGLPALVGRQAPQVLQALSHLALLAERLHPQTLERLQLAGRGHTIQQAVLQLLEVLHRLKTPTSALPSGAFGKKIGRAHVELQSLMRTSYAVF